MIDIYNSKIKRLNKKILLLIVTSVLSTAFYANNLSISNVSVSAQNASLDFSLIKFDVSWDNSWKTSGGPANWDAAWVFVKYRLKQQPTWNHATLHWVDGTGSADGHTEPTGSDINSANDNGAGGAYGVFVHRDAAGSHGTVNYTGMELRWDYGADGLSDNDSVELCVLGVEMVYVTQGAFYLGSGGNELSAFYKRPSVTSPYQVTSEGGINVSTSANNLYYTGNGDYGNIPPAYPKGFDAFYCMKYEITQGQYLAFLNKLTSPQALARVTIVNAHRQNFVGTPGAYTTTMPYVACGYLDYNDVLTYLDWAALRPMTELEFEKAARGPIFPVPKEYAWGTAVTNFNVYTISAGGAANEGIASNYSTSPLVGNAINSTSDGGIVGPLRVGIFAANTANTNRVTSGSSYYGIMEMSGNIYERIITVGNATGRLFTGIHGDGKVTPVGLYDVTGWGSATASGLRGGSHINGYAQMSISDRNYGRSTLNAYYTGGRGVRTAP